MLNDLETKRAKTMDKLDRTIDVSAVIAAIIKEEQTPHEDESEVNKWELMYEGVTFYDDMNGFKKLNKVKVLDARRLEMHFF